MIELNFKKWLAIQEATTTADVAGFQRPTMGMVRRGWKCNGKEENNGVCGLGGDVLKMTFNSK